MQHYLHLFTLPLHAGYKVSKILIFVNVNKYKSAPLSQKSADHDGHSLSMDPHPLGMFVELQAQCSTP
jgi:hypothetical protein